LIFNNSLTLLGKYAMASIAKQISSGDISSELSRDREKKGGEGRGTGFLNWLKEQRKISKSQAYSLWELMGGNLRLW
jgi:hypothetical protein